MNPTPQKKFCGVIDCTPKWADVAETLLDRYADEHPDSRPAIREEIKRMAEVADLAKPALHLLKECQQLLGNKDFINRQVREPLAVRLAGEYDIWDKRDPRADLFQHGLRSEDPDFLTLLCGDGTAIAEQYVERLLEQGEHVRYAKEKENASIITGQSFTVEWEGLTFLAVNHARFNSHLFTAAYNPDVHDALLGFCFDGGKGRWKFSLYGAPDKPDIDLSQIAMKYGGGGHKQACGFECGEIPFPTAAVPVELHRKAPFYLIVNTNKQASGGGGRKYPTIDEAIATAGDYLRNGGRSSTRTEDAYYICAPIKKVQLQHPPVVVEDIK